jgi:hypothetical protein
VDNDRRIFAFLLEIDRFTPVGCVRRLGGNAQPRGGISYNHVIRLVIPVFKAPPSYSVEDGLASSPHLNFVTEPTLTQALTQPGDAHRISIQETKQY